MRPVNNLKVRICAGLLRVLTAALVFLTTGVVMASALPCAPLEGKPVVEIVRSGSFNGIAADAYGRSSNDDLIGTISNSNFYRFWDGTCGSYKVPVRIVAPKANYCNIGNLNGVGLVELIHPGEIGYLPPGEFAGVIQAQNDPVYDPLLDNGYHEAWGNLREPFLFGDPARGGGGVIYMGFQANNFGGQLDYIANLPENQGLGLHMDRAEDYAILYRDVSAWLRTPKTAANYINPARPDLCEVRDVVGFGYSYTSWLLKAVTSDPHRPNSTWGSGDPIFRRGLALDGMLTGGYFFGGACRNVMGGSPYPCGGPHDRSEGPMIMVRSETDVQFDPRGVLPGVPPGGNPPELSHYKVHEINSTAHIESPYYPFSLVLAFYGLDPTSTRQNPLDRSPVLRANLLNLVRMVRNNTPLPNSAYIKTQAVSSLFRFGIVELDPTTGNGFGGIKLPQVAAPLGLYRGVECYSAFGPFADPANAYHYESRRAGSGDLNTGQARYLLEQRTGTPPGTYCAESGSIEGLFTPYETVDSRIGTQYCSSLYPTRRAYSERVAAVADRLIATRLLLPEERISIIADAEAAADAFPNCVPPR